MSKEIVIRTPTALQLEEVEKAKIKPNAVFARIYHQEAKGLGQGPEAYGVFDESGSSGRLRGSRPHIPYGSVWCQQCNKPCDFEEGGMHNLSGRPDAYGKHRGYILIRATCHHEWSDIALTFEQARENRGRCIIAFPEIPSILAIDEKAQG